MFTNNQIPTELILNMVPLTFSAEFITIGRLPYRGEEAYRNLRDQYWQSHAFRFDSRTKEILNVSLRAETLPLGKTEDVDIRTHLLLVAKAIQKAILLWIAGKRPIIKDSKALIFWGQVDDTLLLSRAVKQVGLEPISGLEVPIRYEVDCRMFFDRNQVPFLALLVDVSTANVIDIPVSDLIERGMPIVNKFICRRRDIEHDYLQPGLDFLGRVSEVRGNKLFLSDTESLSQIDARQALLEPRLENLQASIDVVYTTKAPAISDRLTELRKPISNAPGKLAHIVDTLAKLKQRQIEIANGINVYLGDLLKEGDELFPPLIETKEPIRLFGAHGNNQHKIPDAGVTTYGPYMYTQHTRNNPMVAVVCEARYRGRVEEFVEALCNGFPDQLWDGAVGKNPFKDGMIGKFRLSNVRLEYEEASNSSANSYVVAAKRLLARLPKLPDLALVQSSRASEALYGNNSPYLATKALFMRAGVPTQTVRIENMELDGRSLAYLLNNVALACYAKLDGIPWVISSRSPTTHELVIGIGSAEVGEGRSGHRDRYVGITTVFQGDGRYLVWGLTRETIFEEYSSALLESLRTVIEHVRKQNGWQAGERVRLICHVYKRLKDTEVQAIKELVSELVEDKFVVEFAFLDISWFHPYKLFDKLQPGDSYWSYIQRKQLIRGKWLPTRGTSIQLDRWRALLQLIGPKEIKQADQGLPPPLLIDLHPDSDFTDLTYLVRQVFHLAYMSWRSFLPSTEPVTIKYSRLIARLLGNLRGISDWDSTAISVGALRGRRWFL